MTSDQDQPIPTLQELELEPLLPQLAISPRGALVAGLALPPILAPNQLPLPPRGAPDQLPLSPRGAPDKLTLPPKGAAVRSARLYIGGASGRG